MRIVFDGYPLLTTKSGVGYLAYNLILSLLKYDQENNYTILYNTSKAKKEPQVNAPERYLRYPYKTLDKLSIVPDFFKNIPLETFMGDFDIFHGVNAWILPVKKARTVMNINDLAYIHYPETIGKTIYKFLSKNLKEYAQRCDRIIAISEYTKSDIVKHLGISPEKIDVTYLAADSVYRPINKNDQSFELIKAKYKLPEKFILYVGNLEPRKNIPALIRSYNLMRKRTGCEHKLVLAGGRVRGVEEMEHVIRDLHIEDQVVLTGYVDFEDIPVLYNLAEVFAYVSKFEGFGLPPLEAMQCGTPVVSSNASSLPEVIGDAGLMVDPFDEEKIADALESLIIDEQLRLYYSQKGQARAAEFSWETTARRTMEIYKKTYQGEGI